MPPGSVITDSPILHRVVAPQRPDAANVFGKVDVENGSLPPMTPSARPPPYHGEGAALTLRHGASLESLNNFLEFGQLDGPSGFGSGFGMGDGAGGDGVQRADYPKQIARHHPLDPGGYSASYQGQHGKDVEGELSPLLQQWDQRARTSRATRADEVFSKAQADASSMSREHCARTVLAGLGVKPDVVETLLRSHAHSEGGTAIINACRLLVMPELIGDPKAHAALQKQLKRYLDAAKGEYSGVYRAFGHDSHKEIEKLKDGIENTVAAMGYPEVKDRLLADLAPALVHALERKNPGMSSEALRGKLPELINAQAFSALTHRMNNANASGLLQDATLLPQLVEGPEASKPPPPAKAAEPVNDFVKHLVSVLGALPKIRVENNAKQTVNQNDWNFQGNKDPRPEKTGDAVPLTIKALPEVDDADAQALDEGIDMTEADSDVDEEQIDAIGVDEQVEEAVQEREDPLRTERTSSNTGLNGAPVHPLLGSLLSDLRQNSRYQHVANGGAHPIPEHLASARSVERDEEEEKTVATSVAGKSDRALPFDRLSTPFEPGKQPSASLSVNVHERAR